MDQRGGAECGEAGAKLRRSSQHLGLDTQMLQARWQWRGTAQPCRTLGHSRGGAESTAEERPDPVFPVFQGQQIQSRELEKMGWRDGQEPDPKGLGEGLAMWEAETTRDFKQESDLIKLEATEKSHWQPWSVSGIN